MNLQNKRDSKIAMNNSSAQMIANSSMGGVGGGLIDESANNLMTQSDLFRNYSEQNKLYLNTTN